MALQKFEKGAVFIDGVLVAMATSCSLDHDPKLNPIETMQLGFAGVSPGSEMTTLELASAVPVAGMEIDFLDKMQSIKVVEVTLFAHSQKTTFKGFVSKCSQKYGTNQAAEFSITMIGAPVKTSTL